MGLRNAEVKGETSETRGRARRFGIVILEQPVDSGYELRSFKPFKSFKPL